MAEEVDIWKEAQERSLAARGLSVEDVQDESGGFWTPEQAAVFAAVDKEETAEQIRRLAEQRAIEIRSREAQEEQKPVPDPESLKLVKEEFLKKMEAECGHKILGLKVVTEEGRRFSKTRLLETPLGMPDHIFTHMFGLSDVICNEDAMLIEHVRSKRPELPIECIPVVQMEITDTAAIKLDATCADTGYISNEEAIRLMGYHRLLPATIVYLRKIAAESVTREPQFLKTGTLDICLFPQSQMPAVTAITCQKLDAKTQGGAVRILLPPGATEFFAEQTLLALLKHFVYVLFKHNEQVSSDPEDIFNWSYVYALKHNVFPDHAHEILLIFGKRANDSVTARVRKRAHKMRLDATQALEDVTRERIQLMASENAKKIAESATYKKAPVILQ